MKAKHWKRIRDLCNALTIFLPVFLFFVHASILISIGSPAIVGIFLYICNFIHDRVSNREHAQEREQDRKDRVEGDMRNWELSDTQGFHIYQNKQEWDKWTKEHPEAYEKWKQDLEQVEDKKKDESVSGAGA